MQTGKRYVNFLTDSRQSMPLLLMQSAPLLPWVKDYIHTNFSFCSNTPYTPLIQLQIPAHLCHPGELRFEEQYLSNDELYEQHCVNTLLPRPYHPSLDSIPPKHTTRALAAAIHYHLQKRMYTKFNASQTEIANLFQVKRKKFLHPSWDMNTILVRNQPNQKSLKHLPRKTHQQKNKQKNHSHHNQLHLR